MSTNNSPREHNLIQPKKWTKLLTIIDLDKVCKEMKVPPVFINDLSAETEADRKAIMDLCTTVYETTDVMDTVPTCSCRRTREKYNEGKICSYCGTPVVSHHNKQIQHDTWIKAPKAIGKFPIPLLWILLRDQYLSTKNFDGMRWAMDPKYPDPPMGTNRKDAKIVSRLLSLGYKRGLSHAEEQLPILIAAAMKEANPEARADLSAFVKTYKDKLFVHQIPIPSKVAVAIEKTAYTNFVDGIISKLLEAVYTAADTGEMTNVGALEKRFTSVLSDMADYLAGVVKDTVDGHKNGWLRRVLYGTRMNFSFRSIISSLHDLHEYDTTMIPYSQMLSCMEPIVQSKLVKFHGFTLKDAMNYTSEHALDYDNLLWEILEEIIDDTPPMEYESSASTYVTMDHSGKPILRHLKSTLKTRERKGRGIYIGLTRYPSLARTSTQGLRVVGITKNEIRLSILDLVGGNADFDGDMETGTIALDQYSSEHFKLLSPHYDIHSTANPMTLKNNFQLPDITVTNIARWFESEEMVITEEDLDKVA